MWPTERVRRDHQGLRPKPALPERFTLTASCTPFGICLLARSAIQQPLHLSFDRERDVHQRAGDHGASMTGCGIRRRLIAAERAERRGALVQRSQRGSGRRGQWVRH